MLTRTPWTPPAQLAAERALLSMALTLGPDAPAVIWSLTGADFYDHRHAGLWRLAATACRQGACAPLDAAFDLATPRYLGLLAIAAWGDPAALVARVRDASTTRRMLDACWHLCAAWADDDKTRWQSEVAKIAAAASGKDAPPDRARTASTYAARALRYEAQP